MTEPRDPNQLDPNEFDANQLDPSTQTFEAQQTIATERPNAGVTYGRSATYSPPRPVTS